MAAPGPAPGAALAARGQIAALLPHTGAGSVDAANATATAGSLSIANTTATSGLTDALQNQGLGVLLPVRFGSIMLFFTSALHPLLLQSSAALWRICGMRAVRV